MQQAVSTSGQQAGWEKREYILILQRPLYIPGQFSCNVFYITILIILQNKAVVVFGAQKKKEGFWCHSEELSYTVCGSIGSALLYYILHKLKKKPFLFKRAHHKISEKSHQLTLILADKCESVPSPRREIPDLVWGVVLRESGISSQSFTPEGIFEVRQAISKVLGSTLDGSKPLVWTKRPPPTFKVNH